MISTRDISYYVARRERRAARQNARARHFPRWKRRRWRKARREVEARDHAYTVSVEAMLHAVVAQLNAWPDAWAHRCYIGTFSHCICGHCVHGKTACLACMPYLRDVMNAAVPVIVNYLAGIFRRDVQ